MVKSKSIQSDQNHFGPTKTVLVTQKDKAIIFFCFNLKLNSVLGSRNLAELLGFLGLILNYLLLTKLTCDIDCIKLIQKSLTKSLPFSGPETEIPVGLIPSKESTEVLTSSLQRLEDQIEESENTTHHVIAHGKVNSKISYC